jgi:hypothetical protein
MKAENSEIKLYSNIDESTPSEVITHLAVHLLVRESFSFKGS